MSDRPNKPSKRNASRARKNNRKEQLGEIEYYMNRNGNDTQIIKNIAVSTLIPKVERSGDIQQSHHKLLGLPYFDDFDEGLNEHFVTNPFWSFTMVVKKGGDHKLLFSSQEDAESLYHVLIKEDLQ